MASLDVWLGPTRVGTLSNLAGDYNRFSFDDAYLDAENAPTLSQSFIASSGRTIRVVPRTHRVAPPFFANLLPDVDGALRAIIARQQGVNRTRDFPFLQILGNDLPGAVATRGEEESPHSQTEATDSPERPVRFSLAGVQLKFSAAAVGDRMTLPARGYGGTWIVKLPTNTFPRLVENEFAVMSLATAIGLDVPQIRLLDLDAVEGLPRDLPALRAQEPRKVYAIARFDRTNGERLHCEDFNQIAGQAPQDKYEGKASHWIANVIATICPEGDVDEFVRRLVFGICVGNNDMHLKNWAVCYPDTRNARLAPMYDFVCTRAYYPHGELALSIGGEKAFERVDRDALRRFAEDAEISVRRTLLLADETMARVREVWPAFRERIADPSLVTAIASSFAATPLRDAS